MYLFGISLEIPSPYPQLGSANTPARAATTALPSNCMRPAGRGATTRQRLSAALSFRASTVFGIWGYPMGRVVLAYEMIKGARDPILSIAAS